MAEASEETSWLSYNELAELRGIDRLSAVRIARRRRWPKQKGNDGTIRVAVPRSFLESKRHDPKDMPPDITRKIIGLESRVELLGEELERERGRLHELTEQMVGLREDRAAATARAETLQAEVERLQAREAAAAEERTRLIGLLHQAEAPLRPRWWRPRFPRRRKRSSA